MRPSELSLGDLLNRNPIGFFLTKVAVIDDYSFSSLTTIGLEDILNPRNGKLIKSAQFNFMFDLDWLISNYPQSWQECPIYIFFGVKNQQDELDMKLKSKNYSKVVLRPVKITDFFGTHHSKMMILHFTDGIQIVIHTANMVSQDWGLKTQGLWISPLLPPLGENDSSETSVTNFKTDLLAYLEKYENVNEWTELIQKHNFSSIKVYLVASTPGKHSGLNRSMFGHMKIRKILGGQFGPLKSVEKWPVVCQFSSIGSLGQSETNWLTSQFLSSLSQLSGPDPTLKKPPLNCIYPTVENVRQSLEGYAAGCSLPYRNSVALRQPYLCKYLHQWKAKVSGRDHASPHIKSYCRHSENCTELAWFCLTSANLSKAAWGELKSNASMLSIRSFELGVVFLPKLMINKDSFKLSEFPLPYDLPLMEYGPDDKPWIWDKSYLVPDLLGEIWNV